MTLLAGVQLGPYEIEGLLGVGGMGEVYRARDPRLGREVAVKVLPEEVTADSARLSLFEREARAVAALNHPNILTVHDVGTHDGTPYVVTELLEGETLRELVGRRAPTAQQILTYMLQAARGLEAAHAKDIVHRDLKPENLFLTTDGRVKILDFGLAKLVRPEGDLGSEAATQSRSTAAGQVAGTVLYMSPEQARGHSVDVRSDVFSFGVVLYELLAGKHPFRKDTMAGTLTAIVEKTPPGLENLSRGIPPAIGGIVRRCLEKAREDRYASGHDIAVALEAVLAAPSGAPALREVEERNPYPGLSSFTEKDSSVFFGREREVEELWGRIHNRKLLAVIGPSGAGKTSFVRAGVLANRPDGWKAMVVTPGAQPFRGLGRALGPKLAGDPEALGRLADVGDPEVAVELLGRWRRGAAESLLVVDQFEELFTLNPPEVQERFSASLARLASDVDVHVLLSLRDDFLIRCCEQAALARVLEGLTALLALKPEDLRRAIEEPAKKRGYRFEDEALVIEMIQSVEGARAALPLLAFAVSRLWEKRDRDKKTLTRSAYEEIGGVAGALAQHAEATMDRIGFKRHGLVREIFRNLVTAQGTRAVTDREELLSAFPDRDAVNEVLGQLVDARLLTSYEVEGQEGEASHHRIEVVHESLIKAWPRLVRWQIQDEEGALLRDQLKQAAHLWEEKGRSPDVLWSGTALQEYELWRDRYAGKLTALEDNFATAMVERERRRRRWRRAAVGSLVAGLAVVAVVVSVSRDQAVRQAQMAQAAEVVALGRNELERYPTAALAYSRKSLGIADTLAGRRLAVAALWESPPARFAPIQDNSFRGAFSPDGHWLAVYTFSENVLLFPSEGGPPRALGGFVQPSGAPGVWFTPDGGALLASDNRFRQFRMVSIPDGNETLRFEVTPVGHHACSFVPVAVSDGLFMGVSSAPPPHRPPGITRVVTWPYDGGQPESFGSYVDASEGALDLANARLALVRDGRVLIRPLVGDGGEQLLGVLDGEDPVSWLPAFSPRGDRLAIGQKSGRLTVWPTGPQGEGSPRKLQMEHPEGFFPVAFDPAGRHLAWGSSTNHSVSLWDLEGPPDAEPWALRRSEGRTMQGVFHPSRGWLGVISETRLVLWAYQQPRSYVLRGHEQDVFGVGFTPDSRSLVSCGADGALVWPIDTDTAPGRRSLQTKGWCYGEVLPFTPDGQEFLNCYLHAYMQPLDGGAGRWVFRQKAGSGGVLGGCAIDTKRRWVALGDQIIRAPEKKLLRVLELESGAQVRSWPLAPEGETDDGFAWAVYALAFSGSQLIAAGNGGIRTFDMETGKSEWLWEEGSTTFAASRDGRRLLAVGVEKAEGLYAGGAPSRLLVIDRGKRQVAVTSHGTAVRSVAVDAAGEVIVTGDLDGVVRVGPAHGGEPHLLMGHTAAVEKVVVSPDGQWIASKAGTEIRLWRMPDLLKPPLHTLPYDELMVKLRSFTNLEVVEDEAASTGYRLEIGPFPGWKDVPTW